MSTRILIIGGYGTFGTFICRRLAREPGIVPIVAGRSATKARALADDLKAEWAVVDVPGSIDAGLDAARPDIVIHTSGPFQNQSHAVAEACIRRGCHYIDLADGRDFVATIARLDGAAKAADVLIVSGASSVPALTSAIIDRYRGDFRHLRSVDYAIATAQRTNRGLATARAVLSYAGKPFATVIDGERRQVYGWQGLRWRKFAGLGWRALGNCDVPDLALFPERYPELETIRFQAGLGLPIIQLALWALTWLVRAGAIRDLAASAPLLLGLSRLLDRFGSDVSGFTLAMEGIGPAGGRQRVTFDLTARSGDGPMIPCAPAIVTAVRLARQEIAQRGAMPCVGLIDLDALLGELRPLDIQWEVTRSA